MQRTPHDPEGLARRLLTYEAGAHQTSEELAAAAERMYLRLRARLSVFLGPHGFDSLWARAMVLEGQILPDAGSDGGSVLPPSLQGLQASVRERTRSEGEAMVVAAFASFISLLFTFIGPDLGLRVLRLVWTELPWDAPDTQTGDVTQ
jgi:hypothetical protein